MALDLMAKAKAESIDLRLKLLPLDPDRVRGWFPEWFNRTQTLTVESEEDIERVIEYELGGTATEFVSGPTGEITPEGVEALLKSLASGTATLGPENDWQ